MENLKVIDDLDTLSALYDYLIDKDFIAYDTETTGLNVDAEIIGFSVAVDDENGFYVPISIWSKQLGKLEKLPQSFIAKAIDIIKLLSTKNLIMHNAIFDIDKTEANFKISLINALHTDTMILAHLLDENRPKGLKELSRTMFGESAVSEQEDLVLSIEENGGKTTKACYELYKADYKKIGLYAAKDAILTMKLFYEMVPKLYEENLEKFFYEEECMPLLKGPTYQLNTTGLKINIEKINTLKFELENTIIDYQTNILKEIEKYIIDTYPGTKKDNTFNIGSNEQLAWLLFIRLGEEFDSLTKAGKDKAKEFLNKLPYTKGEKLRFIMECNKRQLKPEKYMQVDSTTLEKFRHKYVFVDMLLKMKKEEKILSTYVNGILDKVRYGVIRPRFNQVGTTGTRCSSSDPNFQNLPRDDKRIKSCVISRPNKVFVGADYSQLEPRIFTSLSQDPILLAAYANGEDFYSALAIPIFKKTQCSADKKSENYLGTKFPEIRQLGKVAALSIAYGTTALKLAYAMKLPKDMCQEIIDDYYDKLRGVAEFIDSTRKQAMDHGKVFNLFGRPRRIPEARIVSKFSNKKFDELPYEYRTPLNLAVNYRVQGTAGSLINRCSIAFYNKTKELNIDARIVMQVHDELIVECDEKQAVNVAKLLKDCMENTVKLQGVALIAEPKIANTLSELK